jgi:hypothetical protein
MEHRVTFLIIIVFSVILTSCSKPELIYTETIYLATVTHTIAYTHTPTKIPTITFTPTPEVDYYKIDIFNESTWPEKYKDFWDGGWLNSKEADRKAFQQFIEKVRTAFFAKEGMTDEVTKMTEIRPELRSIWGMICWAETHKDEVIKNQTFIPVTPTELEWIMTDPTLAYNPTWPEDVLAWKGVILDTNQEGPRAVYGIHNPSNETYYSSDNFGMPIAGKDGSVVVPRSPYDAILGDLAALGYVGGGESRVNLLLMNVLDKDGFHHLAAPAVSLDGNLVAPKGSPAINPNGVVLLSQDRKIDQLQDYHGRKYTASDMFELLGKNMRVNFLTSWDYAANTGSEGTFFEPKSKDDIATRLDSVYTAGDQDNWPWSGK